MTANGKPRTAYNKDKETLTLKGLTGPVAGVAKKPGDAGTLKSEIPCICQVSCW